MSDYMKWGPSWYDEDDERRDNGVEIIWERRFGGYEWYGLALLRRTTSEEHVQYAAYSDSGCSCNYMYELTPADSNIHWVYDPAEARRELVKLISKIGPYYEDSLDVKLAAKAKLYKTYKIMMESK